MRNVLWRREQGVEVSLAKYMTNSVGDRVALGVAAGGHAWVGVGFLGALEHLFSAEVEQNVGGRERDGNLVD